MASLEIGVRSGMGSSSVAEAHGLRLGEVQLPKGKLTCCYQQQEWMPTRQKEQMSSWRDGRFLGVGLGKLVPSFAPFLSMGGGSFST